MSLSPTEQDIATAKSECRKRFGHDRLVGVTFCHPDTGEELVEVVLAELTYADTVAYYDARSQGLQNARAGMIEERLLFPASELLEPIRGAWGAFDTLVDSEVMRLLGFVDYSDTAARPLTAVSMPRALDAKRAAELLRASDGAELLWAECRENGFGWVFRRPLSTMWSMSMRTVAEASRAKRGQLCPMLGVSGDHTIWTATGASLKEHVEELPGRGEHVINPWTMAGGSSARTSARRF